ncbi:hypothetical protein AAHA92_16269 [Salvia divinorum]|uniref:Uncharacterized protein n=1 Tax=Salvia divinorum TaxID=28513 RepID=A0ABD1GYA0_SALDI
MGREILEALQRVKTRLNHKHDEIMCNKVTFSMSQYKYNIEIFLKLSMNFRIQEIDLLNCYWIRCRYS